MWIGWLYFLVLRFFFQLSFSGMVMVIYQRDVEMYIDTFAGYWVYGIKNHFHPISKSCYIYNYSLQSTVYTYVHMRWCFYPNRNLPWERSHFIWLLYIMVFSNADLFYTKQWKDIILHLNSVFFSIGDKTEAFGISYFSWNVMCGKPINMFYI